MPLLGGGGRWRCWTAGSDGGSCSGGARSACFLGLSDVVPSEVDARFRNTEQSLWFLFGFDKSVVVKVCCCRRQHASRHMIAFLLDS